MKLVGCKLVTHRLTFFTTYEESYFLSVVNSYKVEWATAVGCVGKCLVWGKPDDRLGPAEIATGSQTRHTT